jgi:hypothetical protein
VPYLLDIAVISVSDKEDGAAPLGVGRWVSEESLLGHQQPRTLGSPDELVHGEVDGVLGAQTVHILRQLPAVETNHQ